MEKQIPIVVDLSDKSSRRYRGIKQGDNKAVLLINLTYNNTPFPLTGLTARLNFRRPDGAPYFQDSTNGVEIISEADGKIKVTVLSDVLEKYGIVQADISIFELEKKVTSSTFEFEVYESVYTNEAMLNRDGGDLLVNIINAEKNRVDSETARVQAENIRKTNESTRTTNETDRIQAEALRSSNEDIRESQEENRKSAETSRISNEKIRQNNEVVRVESENARVEAELARKTAFDQMQHVDANLEIATARGAYNNLNERLSNNESQLAESAQQIFNSKAVNRKIRKPSSTFIDDDGHIEFYTKWKAIAESKGITITSALITSRVGNEGYISVENIKEMQTLGFGFVSHTHTTPYLTQITDAEIRTEFELSQEWLREHNCEPNILVYPYGDNDTRVRALTREYFDLGIYTSGGVNVPPLTTYRVKRQAIEDLTLDEAKAVVDECVANNGWLIWNSHCFLESWDSNMITKISAIIDYMKSLGIDIITASEGYKRFGNLVDIGDYAINEFNDISIIGADGETYGVDMGSSKFMLYSHLKNVNDINGDISLFKDNCTTKIRFTSASTAGLSIPLPLNLAGILEITRSNDVAFQTYKIYKKDTRYHRYWDGTVWTPWMLMANMTLLDKNTFLNSNLLSSFPSGVSLTYIVSASATGFPSNSAGQLITYNYGGNGYSHQEFHRYSTHEKYIRYPLSDGTWSEWQQTTGLMQKYANNTKLETDAITTYNIGISMAFVQGWNIGNGIVTTYRIGTNQYDKQELRKSASNQVYSRTTDASGNWLAWEKISAI